jgi:hypothetical protein
MIVMELMVWQPVIICGPAFLLANDTGLLLMQELGSLYALIHNDTIPIDLELALQILRDISQGAASDRLGGLFFYCFELNLRGHYGRNAVPAWVNASNLPRRPEKRQRLVIMPSNFVIP